MANTIFTQLNPNFDFSDSKLALRLIIDTIFDREDKKSVGKLEAWFERKFGGKAVAFLSGRAAQEALLKVLKLPEKSEVILQPYTCVAAVNPILWNKLIPIFADIGLNTLCLDTEKVEAAISKNTKVILVQHTFGNSPNMKSILSLAKKHNLLVIEDFAHTFEKNLSGDAAFFSLGRGKVVSGVNGGVATVKNEAIYQELKQYRDTFPAPPKIWQVRQLLYPVLMPVIERCYSFNLFLGKALHRLTKPIWGRQVSFGERVGKKVPWLDFGPSPAFCVLALKQLNEYESQKKHCDLLLQTYKKNVKGTGSFLYNVLSNNAEEIIARAEAGKIFLGNWYRNTIDPFGSSLELLGYKKGSCPEAEKAAAESVNLPVNKKVSLIQAKKIVNTL